ncbi:VWA domain-containing protein [Methylocapsa palsarum]|uniref:MxaL protein n=1 Tax=Methylocapsa palsarum TaxID=1612308 RepID=A0A1I4AZR7_9HYPH|nr:vWA domain-containing protein [Methylocapsa palsarum]SFK61159.1 mxaL protein [Methylocapsa palsarum]
MRPDFYDFRLWLLIGAVLLLAAAFAAPRWTLMRDGYDVLVIVDVTGSMNTRDYSAEGRPVSRLEFVKSALREAIADLPCPSRVALGVFSERRPFLLFEPIDACANYAPLEGSIAALDWRMAWEGDSHIAAGLFRAIDMARELNADLMFLTDGQEAPPLPASGGPPFEGRRGEVRGLIVGVGGYELSPIPKYDDNGREVGFLRVDDVPHENRFGLPPRGAEEREGYNARNAPFGAAAAVGVEHLSSVREPYLQSLAATTGLEYAHLVDAPRLVKSYTDAATARPRRAEFDLRPSLGAAAGVLLFALYAAPTHFKLPSVRKPWRKRTATAQPWRRK